MYTQASTVVVVDNTSDDVWGNDESKIFTKINVVNSFLWLCFNKNLQTLYHFPHSKHRDHN